MKQFSNFSDREKGIMALIFLTLVFASMGLFVRYLNTGFALIEQVYLRIFAAFCLSLVIFRKNIRWQKIKQLSLYEWGLITIRAVCLHLLGITLFSKAILLTKYSNVSFISALPLTAVFGFLFFKEKITVKKIVYVLLAFLGILFISVKDYQHLFEWGQGEIFAFISTVAFSAGYVMRRLHGKFLNNQEITVLTFFVASILLFITSRVFGEPLPISGWTGGLLLAVLCAGAFNVANLFLSNFGFQHVETVLASNLLTLESVFAIILGFLFYKELPILKELFGGVIIIFSVIGMNKLEVDEKSS